MRYRPEAGVTTTPMDDGGLVLLSERSGRLYRCNPTACRCHRRADRRKLDNSCLPAADHCFRINLSKRSMT